MIERRRRRRQQPSTTPTTIDDNNRNNQQQQQQQQPRRQRRRDDDARETEKSALIQSFIRLSGGTVSYECFLGATVGSAMTILRGTIQSVKTQGTITIVNE